MTDKKPYVSPLDIHTETASRFFQQQIPGTTPTGSEIACVVGSPSEEPIPALFHPASRTVYPARFNK